VTVHRPRVLDTSALVTMFHGHRILMRMLDDAEAGNLFLLLPTVAIAEAESIVRIGSRLWEPFLLFSGVRAMELTEHTAIEAGRMLSTDSNAEPLTDSLMVSQVAYEAQAMNAVVVTLVPQAYARFDVALQGL
jgi:hypothetical protein